MINQLFILLLFLSASSLGDSRYIFLFKSSKERAIEGLERQRSRWKLAESAFERTSRLFQSKAVSLDQYQQFETAATLAALDYEIAELKSKQASISYDLALALAKNGQRIPLCRRQQQGDEDTVTKLLKRKKRVEIIPPIKEPAPSGTKLEVQPEPPPEPPPIEPPEPPEPPPGPGPFPMPGPEPIEPPEPMPGPMPGPGPGPMPGPGPAPMPGPMPGPGGGENPPPMPLRRS